MIDFISGITGIMLQLLIILDIIFAAAIVFLERKNPAVTWAWLMVILFLPYAGFVIYLLFGFDANKYSAFMKKSHNDDNIYREYISMSFNEERIKEIQKKYSNTNDFLAIEGAENYSDLVFLNFSAGFGFFTENNSVEVYHDGNDKFKAMIEDIRNAEKFIHIQYYIIRNDALAKTIVSELSLKAAQGVEVKILADGMGCSRTPRKIFKPLIDAGGKVGIFLPPHFIRINYRNHRKICVIDGITGYVGGLNIGEEYLGKSKRFGNWRDAHIRAVGDSVKDLELRFIMDWNHCAPCDKMELEQKYFPIADQEGENVKMQIISSGPDTKWPSIRDGYVKMIMEANHSIFIQTPYFVPDDTIFETLKIAALSGIDVRIMIPANPDHPFVYWAGLSYLGELINAGVKCYQYDNGFVHSKFIVIDSIITSVGTANIDIRSFKLNFEINAFIYNKEVSGKFVKNFLSDLEDCTEIDHEFYSRRSNVTKFKESVSRLLSPLL